MIGYIKKRYRKHLDQVLSTIKLIDVEERYDLHFSRFYGLYFAHMARKLNLTPTHVSFTSLVIGVIGGWLFYYQNHLHLVALGVLLVTWAGVLDSADGQLARMTGQSSEIGRVIDGLIDNLVFISCYIGGTLYLVPEYGSWIWLLTLAAGSAHSYKAGLYEFYKAEYLLLVGRSQAGYIPLYPEEIKPAGSKWYHRVIHWINKDYTTKQIKSTTRSAEQRKAMRDFSEAQPDQFAQTYTSLNYNMLFWWAWLGGSNTHRNAMAIAALLGHFEWYLALSLAWTVGYYPLNLTQRKRDNQLLSEWKEK